MFLHALPCTKGMVWLGGATERFSTMAPTFVHWGGTGWGLMGRLELEGRTQGVGILYTCNLHKHFFRLLVYIQTRQ